METIELTRAEALDVLAALEAAAIVLRHESQHLMVLLEIEDAAIVLISRLWPEEEA